MATKMTNGRLILAFASVVVLLTPGCDNSQERIHKTIKEMEASSSKHAAEARCSPLRLSLRTLTPELRKQMGLYVGTKGVVVDYVEPESPAAKAGIKAGAVIESLFHRLVFDVDALRDQLAGKKAGDQVTIGFWKKGKEDRWEREYAVVRLLKPDLTKTAARRPSRGEVADSFEDGSVDTALWVVGGAKRGWGERARTGVGGWSHSCREVQGTDGYLHLRVAGPRSGNTYGAEAWARTRRDFNDGQAWMIDFSWQADVAIRGHYDYYYIQITDGGIPDTGDVHWPARGIAGTVDLVSSKHKGRPRNGISLAQGTLKRRWSIRVDPKGTAILYDGPSGTGMVLSRTRLDSKKPWHIRFMVVDATSAGFSAGDTRLNLFSFRASTLSAPTKP